MAKTADPQTTTVAPSATIICALQSTGRIGKTTTIEAIASWLDFAQVDWTGVDADPEHKGFSDRFSKVAHLPLSKPDALDSIFRFAGQKSPVAIVDFPAGATGEVLQHIEARQVLDALEARGARLVVLIFGSPDPTAEASLRDVLLALRGRVKYMVVQNDARFSSERFSGSKAGELLRSQGAATLALPALSSLTLREIGQAEAKLRRRLTLAEAREHVATDSKLDLDYFCQRVSSQCEDAAEVLLPSPQLIQRRIERSGSATKRTVDQFADPLDITF